MLDESRFQRRSCYAQNWVSYNTKTVDLYPSEIRKWRYIRHPGLILQIQSPHFQNYFSMPYSNVDDAWRYKNNMFSNCFGKKYVQIAIVYTIYSCSFTTVYVWQKMFLFGSFTSIFHIACVRLSYSHLV